MSSGASADRAVDDRVTANRPRVLAVVGPTASGKSSLAIALAQRLGGEILNCDSTAVYRGFDIGTDKVPAAEQQGIPHHLIDIAEATEVYTAARFAEDAERLIRQMHGRGVLPIVVGGTGLYYRALTRGLFPGPQADPALRARIEALIDRRGLEAAHRLLRRVDPESAVRVMPRDRRRIVRALEVYFASGRPMTAHFAATASRIADCEVTTVALVLPTALTAERIHQRVERQFARGIVDEVRGLQSRYPAESRPFGGLVYRQIRELLRGDRDEAATRALIEQENRRYARRQLIWFRKEPTLMWFDGPGERVETLHRVLDALSGRGLRTRGDSP
jgi:tRNA dimethylallyltransferase